jgi:tetratricopeptide (TPR) repeat protein
MKSNQYSRAKDLLQKYHTIQPNNNQAICLIAEVLQRANDTDQAKSWLVRSPIFISWHSFRFFFIRYLQALSTHRTDAHLHRRIGELIDAQGDKADAIQYYFDVNFDNLDSFEYYFSYSRLTDIIHAIFQH